MSSMGALRGEEQSQLEALGEDPSVEMALSSLQSGYGLI